MDLTREAGVALPRDRSRREFWDHELPEALLKAGSRLGPRYDAVVADEGQDFDESWWPPLLYLLRDPDRGIFYVFYDDNQAIFRTPKLPEGLVPARPGSANFTRRLFASALSSCWQRNNGRR